MKPKPILISSTIGLLAIGVILAAIPFLRSMGPTAQAFNDLPRINIAGIAPGEYRLESYIPTHTSADEWRLQAFVYKKINGEINAWRLFSKNGAVGMPDLRWVRPMFECKKFGPTEINGNIDETKPITCHDDDVSDYWRKEWRWTIDGKNMGNMVEDMDSISGSIEGDFFVVRNSG